MCGQMLRIFTDQFLANRPASAQPVLAAAERFLVCMAEPASANLRTPPRGSPHWGQILSGSVILNRKKLLHTYSDVW